MGLFDRFYYGKAGKADYTPDDMPANRWQLFAQVFKTRFWSLARVNLLQLLFWLPFLGVTLLTLLSANAQAAQSLQDGAQSLPANWAGGLLFTYSVLLIPCILITGPSSAAAAYVTRNWSRDQHAFIWSDYWDAFKANWKQGLAVSAITSVLPAVLVVGYIFYGELARQYAVAVVAQALLGMAVGVWALALTFFYPLMVTYTLKLGTLLRNGLLLAVGRLPHAVGIRLLTLLPLFIAVAALLMGSLYGIVFAVLYYLLLGFALHRLVYASFANSVFDKLINPRIEGAPTNLGLRAEDDEDDGEDEGP
ncbi:MAG: YesL family protein [Oscillospiraceae bacterium]|jgi:uncharacterized membrane protein YesL|nr:YesL family protein [Oscillospiraceae bacterium]